LIESLQLRITKQNKNTKLDYGRLLPLKRVTETYISDVAEETICGLINGKFVIMKHVP
jgi:hypothetical protein